ncbi:APC family permease [Actinomadura sp. KC216]|uniref:APC family permease n=1 Tax=Actinomadura sp. KC216 TaxID=2530370 RepID=UPI0010486D5F|nr:APC family permease [Actinomadura sp. KC216]TDB85924.1 APC family permease [Actinomadura sp. KC216]
MTQSDGELQRKLTWRDGFAIALLVPVSIFAALGPSIASIGTLAVATLFAVSCTVGLLQNYVYAELAGMFPNKAGGVALYAHEGWRRYFSPIGAIASFGYWAGWSFGVAVMALGFGTLVQAEFFPDADRTVDLGPVDAGLGHALGVASLVFVSWLNMRGIKFTALLAKILGHASAALILIFTLGPFLLGEFSTDGLTWKLTGGIEGWHVAVVFLFLFAWSAYGTEVCATFTPEYEHPKTDTPKALRLAALVTLAGSTLSPLGIAGTVGDDAIAADPGGMYAAAFAEIIGPASWLISLLLAASFLLVMNGATADSGRALYGVAKAGLTIRQLDRLNRNHEPHVAILVAFAVNAGLVLFVGNPLGIIFAANVGYVLANVLALSAFLLLRRDRPGWPRMIRLRGGWIAVAAVLAAYNAVILVVGALSPGKAGYGGLNEQLIGIGTLLISVVLLAVRVVLQDGGRLRLRDDTPATPPPTAQSPVA